MKVELAYGDGTLAVDVPEDRTTIVRPAPPTTTANERALVEAALVRPVIGPPFRRRVPRGGTVAIAICDGTRPQPRKLVVAAVLEALEGLVSLDDVVVLVATGTHRGNTPEELRWMLGDEVLGAVRVVNHDARDESKLTWLGRLGANVPVWLNREFVEADFRITTGFVEPHFFAGFSGGPKLVAPGLAGLETTLTLHDAGRIGHPAARWGITEGNPVHDDVRAIAAALGQCFGLDVVLDGEKRVVAAFAGDVLAMHREACALVRRTAMQAVDAPFDVVLTSNAGFPLDQNLYQAVKGMSAAAEIVSPGGTIVCVAELRDGFPDGSAYHRQLLDADSPDELLATIAARDRTEPDQWQLQIQAKIQQKARVIVHTSGISPAALAEAHVETTQDPGEAVREALTVAGPRGRVCVLPYGPLTVPYLA
jgi:lactate racemase